VGGIPELIRDGETGYVVPRADAPALAERLLRLIANPALRNEMGAAGRARAEAMFDVRERVTELLRFTGVQPA
jgi:glycosyltransferase involved in cell wall biosynthesis